MTVRSLADAVEVPAFEIVVRPTNVIPLVIKSVLLQLAVPAGTITVSPLWAELMAALTAAKEGLLALMVAACAARQAAKSSAAMAIEPSFLPGTLYSPEGIV
jgi:hypothetical protein